MIPDNVVISNDFQQGLEAFLAEKNYSRVAVLVDENTEAHCLPMVSSALPDHWLIRIKSGESQKNLVTCDRIWQAMTEASLDRKSLLINLGGGVIGDMGGFCASTFKRGMDFINIPTTLLSQVDASVGGKLGIDFNGLKNHIGLFQDPVRIFVASQFINTLTREETRSGFAEVLKHALIADPGYWELLIQNNLDGQDWEGHIHHSIGVKGDIVAHDPLEKGRRKLLNFGHTIGHAIETAHLETDQHLLHGEAIAIGMICEAFISTKKSGLKEADLEIISRYLLTIFGSNLIEKNKMETILGFCQQDKKNLGNVINCTLLKHIGEGTIDVPISAGEILDSIFYYNQLSDK